MALYSTIAEMDHFIVLEEYTRPGMLAEEAAGYQSEAMLEQDFIVGRSDGGDVGFACVFAGEHFHADAVATTAENGVHVVGFVQIVLHHAGCAVQFSGGSNRNACAVKVVFHGNATLLASVVYGLCAGDFFRVNRTAWGGDCAACDNG